MNKKFHRIMVDGETYYREIDCGEVVGPLMEEDEFFDLIMWIRLKNNASKRIKK